MSGFPVSTVNPLLVGGHNFPGSGGSFANLGVGIGSTDGRPNLNGVKASTLPFNQTVTNSTVFVTAGLPFVGQLLTSWFAQYVVRFTAPNPAGDLKIQLAGPAGFAYHLTSARVDAGGATVLIDDSTGTVTVQGAGATVRTVVITASVAFGLVGGAVQLQFAQNTANATGTVILAGSTVNATQSAEFVASGGGQRFRIGIIGDSISDGSTLSTYQPLYWGQWFRRYMAGILGLPDGGPGLRLAHRMVQTGTEFTRTGTWSDPSPGDNTLAYNKAPGFRLHFSSDNAATFTYTKPAGEAPLLRCELVYIDGPASGDYQVSFDGGAFQPLGLGLNQNNQAKTIYLSQPFASTIAFRNNQAGGTIYPLGLGLYDGFSGLVVDIWAIGGTVAGEYQVGTNGADALNFLSNGYVPRVTVINFGANEMILGNGGSGPTANALANYSSNLTNIVTRCKAFGDVILLFGPRMALSGFGANLPLYGQLEQQALAVALTQNIPFVSVSEAWGDFTTANANGLMFDAFHPSGATGATAAPAAGARDIARRVAANISAAVC